MAHPNEDLLERYFIAAERGDTDALDELFADGVRAHIAGSHALSGDYRGKEAVFGFFAELARRSAGSARLLLRDAVADDWFAVALVDASGQVAGKRFDGEKAALVPRIEDGKFVEFWSHHYDQRKMDLIWSQLPAEAAANR